MIKIAICDDEKLFLDRYIRIINNIKKKHNYNVEIFAFNSGKELVKDIIINDNKFDLIFLDIIMDLINGIETAKKIRSIDESIEIVFLTSSKDYALDGYEIGAFNYILKNTDSLEMKINKAIEHSYSKVNDYIFIKNKSCIEKIEINKIVYVESDRRKVIINTVEMKYDIYEKLDNIYEKIKKFGFVRCHRSYIINLDFIKKIDSKDIVTSTDVMIPISRANTDEVKNKFMEYLENAY